MEMIGYLMSGLGLALIGPTVRQHKTNIKENPSGLVKAQGFAWIAGITFMILIGLIFVFATPVSER